MMEPKRKGAKSLKDISDDILDQLNGGVTESVNLTEWLAVDAKLLLTNVLQQTDRSYYLAAILSDIDKLKKQTVNTMNEAIGIGLLRETQANHDNRFLALLSTHVSDTVRCWATYMIGRNTDLTIEQKLEQLKPFAADPHFGVREIAWMAVRRHLIEQITRSITILKNWTQSENENIRRFASEATRPRGVWCEHSIVLKENPELALDILTPLRSDPSKYVRDSVGNWLNDAAKSQPLFVVDLCKQWQTDSPTKETAYIIKKAMRTLNK